MIMISAIPAVSIPKYFVITVVPIPKSTAVRCGSEAIPVPVWNLIELKCGFMGS